MKRMKYNIQFLGLVDYYGQAIIPERHLTWLKTKCQGNWRYDSPNAPVAQSIDPLCKPTDAPVFFDMIFSFSRKKDYERFLQTFT